MTCDCRLASHRVKGLHVRNAGGSKALASSLHWNKYSLLSLKMRKMKGGSERQVEPNYVRNEAVVLYTFDRWIIWKSASPMNARVKYNVPAELSPFSGVKF